jgi:hypothetical protein
VGAHNALKRSSQHFKLKPFHLQHPTPPGVADISTRYWLLAYCGAIPDRHIAASIRSAAGFKIIGCEPESLVIAEVLKGGVTAGSMRYAGILIVVTRLSTTLPAAHPPHIPTCPTLELTPM